MVGMIKAFGMVGHEVGDDFRSSVSDVYLPRVFSHLNVDEVLILADHDYIGEALFERQENPNDGDPKDDASSADLNVVYQGESLRILREGLDSKTLRLETLCKAGKFYGQLPVLGEIVAEVTEFLLARADITAPTAHFDSCRESNIAGDFSGTDGAGTQQFLPLQFPRGKSASRVDSASALRNVEASRSSDSAGTSSAKDQSNSMSDDWKFEDETLAPSIAEDAGAFKSGAHSTEDSYMGEEYVRHMEHPKNAIYRSKVADDLGMLFRVVNARLEASPSPAPGGESAHLERTLNGTERAGEGSTESTSVSETQAQTGNSRKTPEQERAEFLTIVHQMFETCMDGHLRPCLRGLKPECMLDLAKLYARTHRELGVSESGDFWLQLLKEINKKFAQIHKNDIKELHDVMAFGSSELAQTYMYKLFVTNTKQFVSGKSSLRHRRESVLQNY